MKHRIWAAAAALFLGIANAGNAAEIRRDAWSFDRSDISFAEWTTEAKEKAAKHITNMAGWAEYDFVIDSTGWYELSFSGMPATWSRDIYVDGNMLIPQSIALPDDGDGQKFKEANLYLPAGKHSLRIRRLGFPGQLPTSWTLVSGDGGPAASVRVVSVADAIVAPDESFQLKVLGGGIDKPLTYEVFFKSLTNDSTAPAGTLDFPAGKEPVEVSLSVKPPGLGAYTLVAQVDGKFLRPNDLKSGVLAVSKAVGQEAKKPIIPTALAVGGVYNSNMVVQREMPLPVWGWAPPGTDVTLKFAGQTQTTSTDAQGRWKLILQPVNAVGPHQMLVSGGGKTVQFDNILAGEVWLLSGQSNMGGQLRGSTGGREAAKGAKFSQVLLSGAASRTSTPADPRNLDSGWNNADASGGKDILNWNAIAFAFGTDLHKKLNVPVGMVINNRGGTSITSWTSRTSQEREPMFQRYLNRFPNPADGEAGYHLMAAQSIPAAMAKAKQKNADKPLDVDALIATAMNDQRRGAPAGLYDTLIEPLAPFPFRGVVWYQGEADCSTGLGYTQLLKTLIGDWRREFGQELPFVVAQIAYSSGQPAGEPGESRWAEMQVAQHAIASVPHASVITTYDLFTPTDDIHYHNKLPVGHRAAAAALHDVYGLADVVSRGPQYKSMKAEAGKIRLSFTDASGGLKAGGERLRGFMIAGEDRKLFWADAVIDGDDVIVSSDKVPAPAAVRYGWSTNLCGANLFNGAGLPAPVFRTDDWPLGTSAKAMTASR